MERNEKRQFRITHMSVKMFPQADDVEKLKRCRSFFEDFCIVTQSVRKGIPVDVEVFPCRLKGPAGVKEEGQ